ncbi:MAG: cell wall metabolism sensor histidine kinase WalK [Clostridiales bacterium]|nr:cell wall metabolism sensor histidine kinase WalK [Clostridiales bacterium]
MLKTIQLKLITLFIALIILVLAVLSGYLLLNVSAFYAQKFRNEMNSVFSEEFVDQINLSAQNDNASELNGLLLSRAPNLGVNANRDYYILSNTAEVIFTSSKTPPETLNISANITTAMGGQIGNSTDDTNTMDFAYPTANGYIIYILDNRSDFVTLSNFIFSNLSQTLIFGVVLAILFGFLLSRSITVPIGKLTQRAKLLASGDYETRIDIQTKDEVGNLANTFDYMAKIVTSSMQQLASEKNKLETMLMHMTDGVIAFSLDGQVVHINTAAKKMLNIADNENIEFDELFKQLDGKICIAELIYLEDGNTRTREIDLGETVLDFYFATFKDEQNKLNGIVTVIHDITESEKLDKMRHEFVANVSHELRTPLTTIKGYAETMLDDPEQDESSKHFLQVIINEVDRMTQIVKDLLTLSTLGFNSALEEKEYFSLDEMIREVVSNFAVQVEQNGHQLTYSPTTNIPPISANKGKIEQVLVNIISNAIKYTPQGKGVIEVFAGSLYNNVYIKVQDNGIGIPQKDLPRIFERFYRIDKARARDKGGTGLGLAIAQEIVQLHGGSINIESKLNKGTEVIITLPISEEN